MEHWLPISLLYVLFLIFHFHVCLSTSSLAGPNCHAEESSVLLQFKSSFSIDTTSFCQFIIIETVSPIVPTNYWNKSIHCCKWIGIMCGRVTGHVIGLDLKCSSLYGNDFRGSPILSEFGQFKNMTHLALSQSNFSNHVPLEIFHLCK